MDIETSNQDNKGDAHTSSETIKDGPLVNDQPDSKDLNGSEIEQLREYAQALDEHAAALNTLALAKNELTAAQNKQAAVMNKQAAVMNEQARILNEKTAKYNKTTIILIRLIQLFASASLMLKIYSVYVPKYNLPYSEILDRFQKPITEIVLDFIIAYILLQLIKKK